MTILLFHRMPCDTFSTHILTRRMTAYVLLECDNHTHFSTHILTRRMTAILNKNTLSKTARIIPFEYNTLKIYIFLIPIYFSSGKAHHFPVRISQKISVRLLFALKYQSIRNIKSRFCANMFYLIFILIT